MLPLPDGLAEVPIVGIIRGYPTDAIADVVAAAADGGLRAVEITLDTPGAFDQIVLARATRPELTVGVGSVLDTGQVRDAADAGAAFVVTPTCEPQVIESAARRALPCIPGAATPTEIRTALAAGASAVKVFPADLLGGPAFLAAVMSPLRRPPLVPTGGIDVSTAADYLRAGAVAVGASSALFPTPPPDPATIATGVRAWVRAVT